MDVILIAFTGYSGSGKSTACDYLREKHGFRVASFADPLKRMVKIAFDFSDEQLWGPSEARNAPDTRYPLSLCPWCRSGIVFDKYDESGELIRTPPYYRRRCGSGDCGSGTLPEYLSPRIALQTLGDWGRGLYSDVFAQAAIREIATSNHNRWCISDLRFSNELDVVRRNGGHVYRLERGAQQFDHASENQIASLAVDTNIDNTGSLADLYKILDALVKQAERDAK